MKHKRQPYTLDEIKNSCKMIVGEDGKLLEVCRVTEELVQGLEVLSKYKKLVTIYGSAQFTEAHPMVAHAEEVAARLVREVGAGIITGGGPGIMGAANRGAFEAGGISLGATIVIPNEQTTNPYVTEEVPFQYFFTRKTALRFASQMAICFPGGYGTLDEMFEILNLIKTGKIAQMPIVLYGAAFWKPLDLFFRQTLTNEYGTIAEDDMNLYTITDSVHDIIDIAKAVMVVDGEAAIGRE
jgi:uncharacterized protein (TIGR00730 family)